MVLINRIRVIIRGLIILISRVSGGYSLVVIIVNMEIE